MHALKCPSLSSLNIEIMRSLILREVSVWAPSVCMRFVVLLRLLLLKKIRSQTKEVQL